MTPNLLGELEWIVALSKKATPGPWERGSGAGNEPATMVYCDDALGSAVANCHLEYTVAISGDRELGNAALIAASVNFLRTHHAEIADMAKRLEALQSLAAAMYQAAGAYDMPARFLDVLSAAGNGKPITEEQVDALLPCETPDTLQRLEAAERKLSRLTGMRNEWERDAREHLMTFGQHLPASVECLVERFDAAIDATQEGEG